MPTKGLALQNYREKEAYLQFEVRKKAFLILAAVICNKLTGFFSLNFLIAETI